MMRISRMALSLAGRHTPRRLSDGNVDASDRKLQGQVFLSVFGSARHKSVPPPQIAEVLLLIHAGQPDPKTGDGCR